MNTLQAKNLIVRLGSRNILDNVTIRCQPGTVTAIVGPNGAGKSTLLSALSGLRPPSTGAVTLGEHNIFSLAAQERARKIGFIPQYPEIAWQLDVRTVVELGRSAHGNGRSAKDRAAIARALAITDTTAFAERDITTLSGGERARVILARALAGEPSWLLADEPFAGLDPRHRIEAADIFCNLARAEGKGVVVTLHDLTLAARMADHVVVIAHGKVAMAGPPASALTPETLATAYGVRARMFDGESGTLIEILGRSDN